MKRTLIIVLTLVVLAGGAGLLVWSYLDHRSQQAAQSDSNEPIGSKSSVSRDANGNAVVKFDEDTQKRLDIHSDPVAALTKRNEMVAYGQLEEDPSRSFVVRAPLAGTVRGTAWPDIGQTLADGFALGSVEPRLAMTDRVTQGDRLASAQAEGESGRAALIEAQAALTRAKTLNADNKNVSDRAVQEAEARVATEQAHITAAAQSVKLLEASLGPTRDAAVPLVVERGGQVLEVLAHPGESVDTGQPILRVARFDRLLARVDVPAGESAPANLSAAEIVPLGQESHPIHVERIALAATVDPKTQGQPFLFRVPDASFTLRPGLSVTAYLEVPGAPRKGVAVPRSAVVRQSGKAWVYVQTATGEFTRREVNLEDPVAEGWFTTSLSPGDKVVTRGAQTLLSEELKSLIQVEEESQR